MQKRPLLSLIVPYHNQEAVIPKTYRELNDYLQHVIKNYELLFVDDGSIDRSTKLLKKISQKNPRVQIISYSRNRGRGYAIKTGFHQARGKYIGYINADLKIDPGYIGVCLQLLSRYDAAIVSKHHELSVVETTGVRDAASRFFNWWVRFILKSQVHDHEAGLKIFNRSALFQILPHVHAHRWLFDVEVLYLMQQSGFRIGETPVTANFGPKPIPSMDYQSFLNGASATSSAKKGELFRVFG